MPLGLQLNLVAACQLHPGGFRQTLIELAGLDLTVTPENEPHYLRGVNRLAKNIVSEREDSRLTQDGFQFNRCRRIDLAGCLQARPQIGCALANRLVRFNYRLPAGQIGKARLDFIGGGTSNTLEEEKHALVELLERFEYQERRADLSQADRRSPQFIERSATQLICQTTEKFPFIIAGLWIQLCEHS